MRQPDSIKKPAPTLPTAAETTPSEAKPEVKPEVRAANEDSPTGGQLFRLLRRRPSTTSLWVAGTLTLFYASAIGAYWWGKYGTASWQDIPPADLSAIVLALFIPLFLVWIVTYAIWRGQEMRLMADALARTAIRLTEPEDLASQQIASIGQAVRREILNIRNGMDDALNQAMALNRILVEQLERLEAGTNAAEFRAQRIEEVLSKNRTGLEEIARVLGTESDTIARAIEAQIESVRKVRDQADTTFREAADTLSAETERLEQVARSAVTEARDTAEMLERQSARLEVAAETALAKADGLSERFESQRDTLAQTANALEAQRGRLEATFVTQREELRAMSQELTARTSEIEETVGNLSQALSSAIESTDTRARALAGTFREQIDGVSTTAAHATEAITRAASSAAQSVEQSAELMRSATTGIQDEIDAATKGLHQDLESRTKSMRETVAATTREVEEASERMSAAMFRIGGAAKDAGRGLHGAADELHKRMSKMPEEAAESAEAMRKVLEEQIAALADIADIVVRHARVFDRSSPVAQAAAAPAPEMPFPAPNLPPARTPASPLSAIAPREPDAPRETPAQRQRLSDLIAAARKAELAKGTEGGSSQEKADGPDFQRTSLHVIETLQSIAVDLDRALEQSPPVDLWRRYQSGERNVFTRRLYNIQGRELYDKITVKYRDDREFRDHVDRYIRLFERLLNAAADRDRDNILAETYLTSDTGKVYLMLAQASGHIS